MTANKIKISEKNIFVPYNPDKARNIIDGRRLTRWIGTQLPTHFDVHFNRMYHISKIELDVAENSFCFFDIFSSKDGTNYSLVTSQTSCKKRLNGKYEFSLDITCSDIRFLLKYSSRSSAAEIVNAEFYGEAIYTEIKKEEPQFPCDFKDSEYNRSVTKDETVEELYGIVERTVGKKYRDWFLFEINDGEKEYYELSDLDGKTKICANSGVNAAVGLNYYYKYFCFVNISQVGNRVVMPEKRPEIGNTIYFKSPFKVRYSYNYCTLSYTMAFWGEEQWQKELDWLALQGVNVVLDITAEEEVWRRFLMKIGFSLDEAKAFITGPAYYAWFNMANIYAVGGPVHNNFFKDRTELARKNHLFMKKMGMMPVLQGYMGMVPKGIDKYIPNIKIIKQGLWNGLLRPDMVRVDTDEFDRLCTLFYDCQKEVFGDCTNYFAVDPFHEGGRSGSLDVSKAAEKMMNLMLKSNENSVWILQAWGENPSEKLLKGLEIYKDHVLVLDLYSEKRPRWENFRGKEFMSTPWAYCMLNNFGGRMGLHGHLRTIATEVARAGSEASYMAGIGITPEATHSNPIAFDLFFETAWTSEESLKPIKLNEWFKNYIKRRYGEYTEEMYNAILLLNETVYNPELNENGEGAPESVINARPALKIKSASSWGNGVVAYDKAEFEKAVTLFASQYDKYKDSEGYMFDLADLLKQVLSNTAQEYHKLMVKAFTKKDLDDFYYQSNRFLGLVSFTDKVLSCEKEFLLGNWIDGAKKLSENYDEFTKIMFEFNARALITTWAGNRTACDIGGLRDYSNKQWSGLTKDLYLKRWQKWVSRCIDILSGKRPRRIDYFYIENNWCFERNDYPAVPSDYSLKEAAEKILSQYSVNNL